MKLYLLDKPTEPAKALLERNVIIVDSLDEADAVYTQLTPIHTTLPVFTPCTGKDHVQSPHIIHLDNNWKHTQGRTITSTAEHTFSLILQLAKLQKVQLRNKTLGIIGYGRIGRQVAKYAEAFGMNILLYDIALQRSPMCTSFKRVLSNSDIITIHVPFNEQTKHLIGISELQLLKNNAILVNTSRPAVVDEAALLITLDLFNQILYGNDFDQFPNHPQVIATPHIGGSCHEARVATDIYVANKIIEWSNAHAT